MTTLTKWITLTAALTVQAIIWGFAAATFTLWAASWIKTFGAPHSEVMLIITLMQIATGLYGPLAAYFVERFPVRTLMAAGTVLFAGALFLVSLAGAIWQIALLYAVLIAAGMVLTGPLIGQILAVRLFPAQPGAAIGAVTLGVGIGSFLMPPIAAHILMAYGWRDSFAIISVAMAVILLPIILFAIRDTSHSETRTATTDSAPEAHGHLLSNIEILKDRVFWGAILIVLFLCALFDGIFYNLGPWLAEMGDSPGSVALLASVGAGLSTMGIFCFGALADRIGFTRLLVLAFVVTAGGGAIVMTGPSYGVLLVVLPAMAFVMGGMISLLPFIMVWRFGKPNFARTNGLASLFFAFQVAGAIFAGIGRDLLGTYPAAFGATMTLLIPPLLGFALVYSATPHRASFMPREADAPL